MNAAAVTLSPELSIPDVVAVARGGSLVRELDGDARARVERRKGPEANRQEQESQ